MSDEISKTNEIESLFPADITNIYSKLSIEDNSDFDSKEEVIFVQSCIEECYDKEFKQIDTKILQENDELINVTFVNLLKNCIDKKFKKVGQIFLTYCDYFDLDYNITFKKLHEKLQSLIKISCKNLIGGNCYKKYMNKLNPNPVNTLFDLVANKK